MAVDKAHMAMMKKLKKQVTVLKRKEKSGRNKLRAAWTKLKKSKKSYERKLEQNSKSTAQKISEAVASVYAKLASSFRKKGKVKRVAPKAAKSAKVAKRGSRKSKKK